MNPILQAIYDDALMPVKMTKLPFKRVWIVLAFHSTIYAGPNSRERHDAVHGDVGNQAG